MKIERVTTADTEELLAIYAPYVTATAISFETEVPSVEEFRGRIEKISFKYPYIKAVDEDNKILGYAYAGTFKARSAYDWSVETTVYIRQECRRQGIGKELYEALEKALRGMGVLNMNACIAVPRCEDPFLTTGSQHFHEKMGFSLVGTFHDSGYKFDTWYDMIWMEKMIGIHKKEQSPVSFGKWEIGE